MLHSVKLNWNELVAACFRFLGVTDSVKGMAHIIPRLSSGRLEFNPYLARISLDKVMLDPQFRAYAKFRGASDAEVDHLAAYTS